MHVTSSVLLQADKLEHMGLARVLPGRNLLDPSVEAAAAKLSAALSAVVQSDVMRSTCQQLRRDIEAEDGAEVAANYIRRALHAPQHNPGSEVGRPTFSSISTADVSVELLAIECAPGNFAGETA